MVALGGPFSEAHALFDHFSQAGESLAITIEQHSNHSDHSDKILDQHCVVCCATHVLIVKPGIAAPANIVTPVRYRVRDELDIALATPSPLFKPPRA